MITADDKLKIFEDFYVDNQLPKYKKLAIERKSKHVNPQTYKVEEPMEEDDSDYMPIRMTNNVMWSSGAVKVMESVNAAPQRSWLSKLAFWKSKPKPEPKPAISIEEFFTSVKSTAQELVIIKERAAGYERAMLNAKQMGQQALYEQLVGGLNAYKMETYLVAIGLTKYVKEEDIVRFYKQSEKGLRLDWVNNFTRIIPESVIAKKTQADKLGIFDNYVVLHYDPKAKSYAETKEQRNRRKDPILFGLMRDRRVLYFVSDWVDEVCDLTLDQLAEHLGRDAIQTISDGKEIGGPYRTPT